MVRIKDPCEKRLPPLVLVTWYRIFADALLYIPFTGESEKAPQVIFLFFISFIAAIQSPSHGEVRLLVFLVLIMFIYPLQPSESFTRGSAISVSCTR